jgi:hypothetical protein
MATAAANPGSKCAATRSNRTRLFARMRILEKCPSTANLGEAIRELRASAEPELWIAFEANLAFSQEWIDGLDSGQPAASRSPRRPKDT